MTGSLYRSTIANGIKFGLTFGQTAVLIEDIMDSFEYPDDETDHDAVEENIREMVKYMLTQYDGLYGVTRKQLKEWVDKSQ